LGTDRLREAQSIILSNCGVRQSYRSHLPILFEEFGPLERLEEFLFNSFSTELAAEMTETTDFEFVDLPVPPTTPAKSSGTIPTLPTTPSATDVLIKLKIRPEDLDPYPIQWIQYVSWLCLVNYYLQHLERSFTDRPKDSDHVMSLSASEYKWTQKCIQLLDRIKEKGNGEFSPQSEKS
jgi:hypothetical protein